MTDEIFDVCIPVSGPNLDVLLPSFFTTFFKYVDTTRLALHVVDGSYDKKISDYLHTLKVKVYDKPELTPDLIGPDNVVDTGFEQDVAKICQWCVDNCGESDVVFLCHFDIIFTGDTFHSFRRVMNRNVGQVGEHCSGIVGYRRRALAQCHLGFRSISHFKVCGDKKIRHYRDSKRHEKEIIRLNAFDTCELLELNLIYRLWDVFPVGFTGFTHFGAGSGYQGDQTNKFVRECAIKRLRELNLEKI